MKKTLSTFMALVVPMSVVLMAGSAMASNTDDQAVTLDVQAIEELELSAAVILTFNATNLEAFEGPRVSGDYVIGKDDFQITDANSTYSVTTNSPDSQKITAYLDTAITAADLKLYVALASESVTSEGEVELTSVVTAGPATLVTGLKQIADFEQVITYRATATVATPVAPITPVVTFTLIDA
ncbi:unknown protein [Desulfotalea psychrophila LSv54]|uniref:Uncharacterized protein n=2 Tax=Desulfotalea psychrophila TaxID=84980 RepID=Q6ALT6_DESPS|nr:unknown protein [Desulfotalea psychrophila LSv54]